MVSKHELVEPSQCFLGTHEFLGFPAPSLNPEHGRNHVVERRLIPLLNRQDSLDKSALAHDHLLGLPARSHDQVFTLALSLDEHLNQVLGRFTVFEADAAGSGFHGQGSPGVDGTARAGFNGASMARLDNAICLNIVVIVTHVVI